jgi:hypothetical protein
LSSLIEQSGDAIDVNFIARNNFNNNAYRGNYRPFPNNSSNNYGGSYGNSSYNNNWNTSDLANSIKEFISTQKAFNTTIEEKLNKIEDMSRRIDRLSHDVENLKMKAFVPRVEESIKALYVSMDESKKRTAMLKAKREMLENVFSGDCFDKNDEDLKMIGSTPLDYLFSKIEIVDKGTGHDPTSIGRCPEIFENKNRVEKFAKSWHEEVKTLSSDAPTTPLDFKDFNYDNCSLIECIFLLQSMVSSPHDYEQNKAFTKHIVDAMMKAFEDKLNLEISIPRKMHDEWEPTIKVKIKNYECFALCDLGASVSTIPKSLCDVLGLTDFEECSLNLHLEDSTFKKPMGQINDVLILANSNYVPVDLIVLDIVCNPSCPIILGRPFLRAIGVVIDMKEGNIKFQFPLRKGMEHFPRNKIRPPY